MKKFISKDITEMLRMELSNT